MTTTTQETKATATTLGERITISSFTRKQKVSDVVGPICFEEGTEHLQPIVVNAITLVVEKANEVRQQRAAEDCIQPIAEQLAEDYIQELDYMMPMSQVNPNESLTTAKVDRDGNIISAAMWYKEVEIDEEDPRYNERYCKPIAVDQYTLEAAVRAANKSKVFEACKLELVLTDGLMLYVGTTNE